MNKHHHQPDTTNGKILIHDQGIGSAGEGDVERRAGELALIDGRSAADENDRAQAKKELAGDSIPDVIEDDQDSMDSMSRDPSDPPAHRGRQIPDFDGGDDQKAVERLVTEGVEEAQHDQMLAARRQHTP